MKASNPNLAQKYRSLETDRLIELHRSGGLTEGAHSALEEELGRRGFIISEKPPIALECHPGADKPESNKGSVSTALFRLLSTLSIFFMVSVVMGSQPIRSRTLDVGKVIAQSLELVIIGPGLLFYLVFEPVGVFISIAFWLLVIISLAGSNAGVRRGFYWLLGVYVVMTLLGLFASIGMGLVAMAGAM
jgi:hypothetical protein